MIQSNFRNQNSFTKYMMVKFCPIHVIIIHFPAIYIHGVLSGEAKLPVIVRGINLLCYELFCRNKVCVWAFSIILHYCKKKPLMIQGPFPHTLSAIAGIASVGASAANNAGLVALEHSGLSTKGPVSI